MKGEWCFWGSAISKTQCQNVIDIIKSRPAKDATLGVEGERKDSQYRRSKIRWVLPGDNQLDWLFADLWKMALKSNDEWFGFHLSKMDYLQVAEYDAVFKGEYKIHHDVFYMNGSNYHRKLSAIIQLSDPNDYEGGDFELYETQEQPDKQAIKAQGSVIFFPSFIRHAALPVTKGLRYSVAAWIDGPRWR
jgi:PKHD-type hydroxylase